MGIYSARTYVEAKFDVFGRSSNKCILLYEAFGPLR